MAVGALGVCLFCVHEREVTHFWRGVRTVGGLRSFMGCRQKWRIVAEMYSSATAARLCESH